MRLCWLFPDDRGGGVASVAISCARQAQVAGHDATLLVVLPLTGWLQDNSKFTLDSLGLDAPAADTPAALLRWLRKHPQDVLVLNGCEQADAAIPYLPTELHCVYGVHDTAARYWLTALRYEEDLDSIVAVSNVVADQFKQRLCQQSKLRVIHNGSLFPPAPDPIAPRRGNLLFLCGDNPTKGAYDMLRLWRCLVADQFEGTLHWFGHMDARFRRRISALPNAGQIRAHGRTPRDRVFTAAAESSVFLMLSRVEPFGMVTIEAMSMGCVPVAWDLATGTREIVLDGKTGLFAPLGDFAKLATQVRTALRNRNSLGAEAMRDARERFGEERMWAGYADLLEEIVVEPRTPRKNVGQEPLPYSPPRRRFQVLPAPLRRAANALIGASPRLGYWLRDQRGR